MMPLDKQPLGKYSIGTEVAVNTLMKQIAATDNTYDTILINILTLIRNRLQKDATITEIYDAVRNELHELVRDIVTEYQHSPHIKQPLVVLYLAEYEHMIPLSILRPINESRVQLNLIRDRVMHEMIKANHLEFMAYNVKVIQLPYTANALIHKSLLKLIYQHPVTQSVLMFSHCPLDYHVAKHLRKFRLIDSYTGKMVSMLEIGDKVFKQPNVPFCSASHAVLGDSKYIKSLLNRQQHQALYQLAEREAWQFKTSEFIKESIIKAGYVIPINFD